MFCCIALLLVMVVIVISRCLRRENYNPERKVKPVVRLHYTNWCPACQHFKPKWEALKRTTGIVDFVEIDEDIAKTPDIGGFPTITMIVPSYNGNRLLVYKGLMNEGEIRRWIAASI